MISLKTINFSYDIMGGDVEEYFLSVSQIGFNKGKIGGRMTYIPLEKEDNEDGEVRLEILEKGIEKFVNDYDIEIPFRFTIKESDSNEDPMRGIANKQKDKLEFDYPFNSCHRGYYKFLM